MKLFRVDVEWFIIKKKELYVSFGSSLNIGYFIHVYSTAS